MKRHLRALLLIPALSLALVASASATTYLVSAGSSVQTAINAASGGDVVRIQAGTFSENIQMKSGVVLRGAGPEFTIIDGSLTNDVTIYVPANASGSTRIEGLSIIGGDGYYGGGIKVTSGGSPVISNCVIRGNNSGNYGGGIYVGNSSSPTIEFCTIIGNTAQDGAGIYVQGGSAQTNVVIRFSVICSNQAAIAGGGINISGVEGVTISNCSVVSNTAGGSYGAGVNFSNSLGSITNCIVAFNSGGMGVLATNSWIDSGCNDIYGNNDGNHSGINASESDISADPQFCALAECDLTLGGESPAATNAECGLIGALPVGCALTRTEATSWGSVKSIFR